MAINLPSNIHPAVAKSIDDRWEVSTYANINTNGPLYPGMLRYVKDQEKVYIRLVDGSWLLFGATDTNDNVWIVWATDGYGTGASYTKMDSATHYGLVSAKIKPPTPNPVSWIPLTYETLEAPEAYVAFATNNTGGNFSFVQDGAAAYTHYGIVVGYGPPVASDYTGKWVALPTLPAITAWPVYAKDSAGLNATYLQATGVSYTYYAVVVGSTKPELSVVAPTLTWTEISSLQKTAWEAYADDATGTGASYDPTGKKFKSNIINSVTQPALTDFTAWLQLGTGTDATLSNTGFTI